MNNNIFEQIKHTDENGNEYWEARELMIVLDYNKWENFHKVIKKAKNTCINSNININEHFLDIKKPIKGGNGNIQNVVDYKLSRYACYLIAQNSDSRKKVIALAQTYFAIQTRRQELFEKEYNLLTEDEKRLYQRGLTKKRNYSLNKTAALLGVKNFGKFHDAGYMGLYGGETANDIRINIKKDDIKGEKNASATHNKIGKIVRNAILEAGGTMPEELLTPNKSIKEIEKDIKKEVF